MGRWNAARSRQNGFGTLRQLSLNKFLDLSTPSTRKEGDGRNPEWPPGGPKMAEGVWKGVYPQVLGRSKQLWLNKFFDPSTSSMRKDRDGRMHQDRLSLEIRTFC